MDLLGKKVLVAGCGKSGLGAAGLLQKAGAVTVQLDEKEKQGGGYIYEIVERQEQTKEETDNGSEHLHEMLYTLSEKYRKVIVLYYMEEMTTKEIANILRISESTVRKRLQRGRDMLRQKGEGQWER